MLKYQNYLNEDYYDEREERTFKKKAKAKVQYSYTSERKAEKRPYIEKQKTKRSNHNPKRDYRF